MREHGFVEGTNGITYVHKKDERRHRKWCVHYHKDGSCAYMSRCGGSAHCGFYGEEEAENRREGVSTIERTKAVIQELKKEEAEEFVGVRTIKIKEIVVPEKFLKQPPSSQKVAELRAYYEEHKKMDKPIYVSIKDGKYYLEDKYLRYYVMKELDKTWIRARIGTCKDSKNADRLNEIGGRVRHRKRGCGTIIRREGKYVTVRFDKGKEVKFDYEICVRYGTLQTE